MDSLNGFIKSNLAFYPEWEEYNHVVLDFISSYTDKRPDICIEGCKSLIEGVSKLIYFNLDFENKNISKWKDFNFQKKFRKAIMALDMEEGYEKEFIEDNFNLILRLGQIRNDRGDIAHGQNYPKKSYSNINFATFISLWSEGLCYFMLSEYIKNKQKEDEIIYNPKQFAEFNNYLDDLHSEFEISYSQALREQDPSKYELLMDAHFIKKDEDLENERR